MNAVVHKFRGCDYMPMKLKALLLTRGISQEALAAAIPQANGKPLSRTAMSFLLNWGYFPKSTPEAEVRRLVEGQLRTWKVPEAEIATVWETEGDDRHRHAQPMGVHVGAPAPKPAKAGQHHPDFEPLEVAMLSPAAKRHFKLFRDPFQDEVNGPDDVFLSAEQRYISEAMFQTAKHGGFLAVVGESGAGKSTLRKMLIERIADMPIRAIFPRVLDKTRLSAGNICQAIINDLAPGEKVRSSLEGQARQVETLLMTSARDGNSHVLVIEEAHDLAITTLKYLKRFYELEDGFKKLLSIVLVGQLELKDKLNERRHPEAKEVIRRCEIAELQPLTHNVRDYLAHKLQRQSIPVAQVFAEDAFAAIGSNLAHKHRGVYPLTVNNLATNAMNKAADLGVPLVCADLIKEI